MLSQLALYTPGLHSRPRPELQAAFAVTECPVSLRKLHGPGDPPCERLGLGGALTKSASHLHSFLERRRGSTRWEMLGIRTTARRGPRACQRRP